MLLFLYTCVLEIVFRFVLAQFNLIMTSHGSMSDDQHGGEVLCEEGSVTFEERRHLPELRDAVLSVAALLLQLLQTIHELPTGHAGINAPQLLVNLPPLNTATQLHVTHTRTHTGP